MIKPRIYKCSDHWYCSYWRVGGRGKTIHEAYRNWCANMSAYYQGQTSQ